MATFGAGVAGDGAAALAGSVRETGGVASCAAVTPAAQFADAGLVFVGRMLPGPTARVGGRRVLGSPARMRVTRYLKGHGPRTVRVDTAVTIEPGGISGNEDGIEPQVGQRWKIYTPSRRQPFATSICAGSVRLRSPGIRRRAAVGYFRTAVIRLAQPLGARVLVSATDGGAVVVTSGRAPAGRGAGPAWR